jgi:Mn-dependent DtxR family transcriptional regulator
MKAAAKSRRSGKREQVLAKILSLIKSKPGIRPSEINRRLKMKQSDALRDALIRRGLVRKVKDGRETHLYAK